MLSQENEAVVRANKKIDVVQVFRLSACKQLQATASNCKQLEATASSCKQLQAAASNCKQLQVGPSYSCMLHLQPGGPIAAYRRAYSCL